MLGPSSVVYLTGRSTDGTCDEHVTEDGCAMILPEVIDVQIKVVEDVVEGAGGAMSHKNPLTDVITKKFTDDDGIKCMSCIHVYCIEADSVLHREGVEFQVDDEALTDCAPVMNNGSVAGDMAESEGCVHITRGTTIQFDSQVSPSDNLDPMTNIAIHGAVEAIDIGPVVSEDVGGVFIPIHLPAPNNCGSLAVD